MSVFQCKHGSPEQLCPKCDPHRKRVSKRIHGLVSLPLDLVERLRDHTEDLRALRDWWATEPRRTYQRDYQEMTKDLEQTTKIIMQANSSINVKSQSMT